MAITKNKVLIFTTIQGHASIAQAINDYLLSKNFDSKIFSYREPLLSLYLPFYRFAPSLMRFYYLSQKYSLIRKIIFAYTNLKHYPLAKKQVEKIKPDIVISTNFGFNTGLAKLKKIYHFKFINIITDPRTYFPVNLTQAADANLVFDDFIENKISKKFKKLKIITTGWFVQDKFEQDYNKLKIRKKLNLDLDKLTFLFATGWEGTEKVLKIIKKLAKYQNINLIIACGTNQNLLAKIKKLNKQNLLALSFTKKLHLYMQAADLIIGKAGPNTLFESVATQTPFLATTHIAGQEDGNLDIIQDYDLGFTKKDPEEAIKILQNIIKNPAKLAKFKTSLKKMAEYNQAAKSRLYKLIKP